MLKYVSIQPPFTWYDYTDNCKVPISYLIRIYLSSLSSHIKYSVNLISFKRKYFLSGNPHIKYFP